MIVEDITAVDLYSSYHLLMPLVLGFILKSKWKIAIPLLIVFEIFENGLHFTSESPINIIADILIGVGGLVLGSRITIKKKKEMKLTDNEKLLASLSLILLFLLLIAINFSVMIFGENKEHIEKMNNETEEIKFKLDKLLNYYSDKPSAQHYFIFPDEKREYFKLLSEAKCLDLIHDQYFRMTFMGKVSGLYSPDEAILIFNDEMHTVCHEVAHYYFKHKLSNKLQEEWKELFLETNKFITSYSAVNSGENFAEWIECYYDDECKKTLKNYNQRKLEIVENIVR